VGVLSRNQAKLGLKPQPALHGFRHTGRVVWTNFSASKGFGFFHRKKSRPERPCIAVGALLHPLSYGYSQQAILLEVSLLELLDVMFHHSICDIWELHGDEDSSRCLWGSLHSVTTQNRNCSNSLHRFYVHVEYLL
jgi:hypothetical protein